MIIIKKLFFFYFLFICLLFVSKTEASNKIPIFIDNLPKFHTEKINSVQYFTKNYKQSGYIKGKTIYIKKNAKNKKKIYLHELGHIVDFYATTEKQSNAFYKISWKNIKERKQLSKKDDFVSRYAKVKCTEDFAESYYFYISRGDEFRKKAKINAKIKEKYIFMKNEVFLGKEFRKY